MKYIYLSRENAKKGVSLVYAVENESIYDFNNFFIERGINDAIEFIGEELPHYITYLKEKDTVKEATIEERIANNTYILSEDEYINSAGSLKTKPFIPTTMAKPIWDNENYQWVDTATASELKQYLHNYNISIADQERTKRHTVFSPTLGFNIDSSSIDLENQKLYKEMIQNNLITNPFKCGDNVFRTLSVSQIDIMLFENSSILLQVYKNKFYFEELINSALTLEELKKINIVYTYSL